MFRLSALWLLLSASLVLSASPKWLDGRCPYCMREECPPKGKACSCKEGYYFNFKDKDCNRQNEGTLEHCQRMSCPKEAKCTDTRNGVRCECPGKLVVKAINNQKKCLAPCANCKTGKCKNNACTECRPNFFLDQFSGVCLADRCIELSCDSNGKCKNSVTGPYCECNPGFHMMGNVCLGNCAECAVKCNPKDEIPCTSCNHGYRANLRGVCEGRVGQGPGVMKI